MRNDHEASPAETRPLVRFLCSAFLPARPSTTTVQDRMLPSDSIRRDLPGFTGVSAPPSPALVRFLQSVHSDSKT